jgi:methylenetetrahydrofolate dehydrogenase (NADP+)/methenyltetrahydrofolate cyclohydrolase
MIFDGKAFAREIEEQAKAEVEKMAVKPKIVSIVVGDDPASVLYTRLKQTAAKRVGIQFEVVKLDKDSRFEEIDSRIRQIGKREDVTGVMVQLPIPGLQGQALQDVLSAIPLNKDVDGLRWEESKVIPATVRAILAILDKIESTTTYDLRSKDYVVLGARGAVGRPLVHFLKERGVEVAEVEWDTPEPTRTVLAGDIVISCTGKEGLVTGQMVRAGAIVIDVGAPKGEMTSEVYQKASVAVAVPNGVGPVTVASLMANAVGLVL